LRQKRNTYPDAYIIERSDSRNTRRLRDLIEDKPPQAIYMYVRANSYIHVQFYSVRDCVFARRPGTSVKNIFFRAGKRDVRQRLAIDEPARDDAKNKSEREREREREIEKYRRRPSKK